MKILKSGYLAFILLMVGCRSNFSIPLSDDKIYPALGVRTGLDVAIINAKVGKKLEDTREVLNPFGGFELSIGNSDTRAKFGGDMRYNSITQDRESDDSEIGFHDIRGNEEFSQLNFSRLSFIPLIGLEKRFFEKLKIGFEAGFPYTKFEFREGNIAEGKEKTDRKSREGKFGNKYNLNISYLFKDPFVKHEEHVHVKYLGLGLDFGYENYNLKFFGKDTEINSFNSSLFLSFNF